MGIAVKESETVCCTDSAHQSLQAAANIISFKSGRWDVSKVSSVVVDDVSAGH